MIDLNKIPVVYAHVLFITVASGFSLKLSPQTIAPPPLFCALQNIPYGLATMIAIGPRFC
jgi:hypothetical protein